MKRWLSAVCLLLAVACAPPTEPPPDPPPAESDGWDDAPGSGACFLSDVLAVSQPGDGLDLDGDGDIDTLINDAWGPMLGTVNDMLRNNVNTGDILALLEVAGLERPYDGNDNRVTLKFYSCSDVDDDPTNNFCGGPGCGEVYPSVGDIADDQALYRSEPVPLIDNVVLGRHLHPLQIDMGTNDPLEVLEPRMRGTLPLGLAELSDGKICGYSQMAPLNRVVFPICDLMPVLCTNPAMPRELSIAQYITLLGKGPDIDVDGDGLETFTIDGNGQFTRCLDGDGVTEVLGADCIEDPRFADGCSLCFDVHGVPARLIYPRPE